MADDYTPSEARVCIDFCNAAIKRPKPDGSVMTMEEADAAFTRFLAEKRAEWEAEQEWEWGVARKAHPSAPAYSHRDQEACERFIANPPIGIPNPSDPWLIMRRRKAGPWLPVPDRDSNSTNHESEGK